jgi:hypothetical protein
VTGAATPTLVTLRNLPAELTTGGYHVYVYSMGGARANRGGSIRILDTNGLVLKPYQLHTDAIGTTTYVKDPGLSHTVNGDSGNYHVFTNVAGSDIVIEATIGVNPNTGTPRASINAVQLVSAGLTEPILGAVFGDAQHFYATILDLGGGSVVPTSVTAVLDGASTNVPVVATKSGGTTLVTYDNYADKGTFFASGSTHTVQLVYTDSAARSYTNSGSFTVPTTTTIPAEYAVSSADTTKSGFRAKVYQMPVPRGPGNRGLAANTERALAGGYLDPATPGQPYLNLADMSAAVNGYLEVTGVLNFNEAAPMASGSFSANSVPPMEDQIFPGIPFGGDFYAHEIQMYLELDAGVYRVGVNSDDGFKLLAGWGAGDVVGVILGQFDGTRGAGDTIFDFVAPVDGFYPIRLVYGEATGGAALEFFSVDLITGAKTLINDLTAAAPIRAFRETTVGRPYVSKALPTRNYGFAFATDDLVIEITDGAVPVDNGSVSATLNGAALPAATKAGNVTTITRPGSASAPLPSGVNNITNIYTFTEGGNTVSVTNVYAFTVAPYAVMSAATKVPAGSVSGSGFTAIAKQIDRSGDANQGNGERLPTGDGNRMPRPEIHLADGNIDPVTGLPYANLAQPGGNPDGSHTVDILNYNSTATGTANSGCSAATARCPVCLEPAALNPASTAL